MSFIKKNISTTLTCALMSCSISVGHTAELSHYQVAAGFHDFAYPVLMISHNQGQSWQTLKENSLPKDKLMLTKAKCFNNYCVVSGVNPGGYPKPFFIVSHDSGLTWEIAKGLQAKLLGETNDLQCHDGGCIAVGVSADSDGQEVPLILLSKDNGSNWISINKINGLNKKMNISLYSVYCKDNICLASGEARDEDDNGKPIVLSSNDNGQTWENTNFKLPIAANFEFNKMKCTEQTCILGGTASTISIHIPYLMVTKNFGKSWTLAQYKTPGNAILNDLACSGENCIAIGSKFDEESNVQTPFILSTKDSGKTWKFTTEINNLPENALSSDLHKAHCSGNLCFATGCFSKRNDPFPGNYSLFVGSQDNGKSWSVITRIAGLHDKQQIFTINDVQCSGMACTAVGGLANSTGLQHEALIMKSFDKGSSWEVIHDISTQPPQSQLTSFASN